MPYVLLPWISSSEPCNSNAKSHIKCDTLWQSKSHSNSKFKFFRGNYNILTGQTKPQTQRVDPTLNSDNVRMMLLLLRHMRGLITTHRSCAPRVLSWPGGWQDWGGEQHKMAVVANVISGNYSACFV